MPIPKTKRERLATHFARGSSHSMAAEACDVSLNTMAKYFRDMAARGMVRGEVKHRREGFHRRRYKPNGLIGVPIGEPPVPVGDGWIGKRINQSPCAPLSRSRP